MEVMGPFGMEEYRKTSLSHKFGGDGLADFVYCELMGNEDESTGDSDFGFAARFGKRILWCNTQGVVELVRYRNEAIATNEYEDFAAAFEDACAEV